MNNLETHTPGSLGMLISKNLRTHRKSLNLSMQRLSQLSGVSFGSIRRFEEKGEISLISLLKIAVVLDCTNEFEQLFKHLGPKSIKEIIDGNL